MWLNESARGQPHQQAVIEQIDKHSVLIKKDKVSLRGTVWMGCVYEITCVCVVVVVMAGRIR